MTKPQLFHCFRSSDAERTIDFLEAIGFRTTMVVRDSHDPHHVAHAQLNWRDNGGVMLGSMGRNDDDVRYRPGVCNLVVDADDDVDVLVAKAVEAGAAVLVEPTMAPHGGRHACVVDFDQNYWNIDSYPGA